MDVKQILERLPHSDLERASYLIEDLQQIPPGQRPSSFLDLGAGSGSMSATVSLLYPGISGVLVDAVSRECFRELLPAESRGRLEFRQWPCDEFLEERSFDLVLSMDVLEHIPDWRGALEQLKQYVKPNGFLYLQAPSAYPSPNWPASGIIRQRFLSFFGKNDPSEHVRHGLSCKDLLDAVGPSFSPVVASESYVVNGVVHCDFKPRTHLLLLRKP